MDDVWDVSVWEYGEHFGHVTSYRRAALCDLGKQVII
jgi:hypothetical protein